MECITFQVPPALLEQTCIWNYFSSTAGSLQILPHLTAGINDEDLKIGTCYFFDELGLMHELQLQMLSFTSMDSQSTKMIILFRQIDNQSWGSTKALFFMLFCIKSVCNSFWFWVCQQSRENEYISTCENLILPVQVFA